MIKATHRKILCDLLALPTAPFAEHFVMEHMIQFCKRRKNVTFSLDPSGNILVRVKNGKRLVKRPVCITAHLDHPGFVTDKMISKSHVRAFWRGGVPKEYFKGSKVRFFVDGKWIKGTIRSIKTAKIEGRVRVDTANIDVPCEIPSGTIGMWDFPDPQIKGARIYARACDDLAGAAAMLCAIDELTRSKGSCDAYFLFTRAEEVGFIGAIAACRHQTIPRKCYVVAMETSSELIHAKMGDGPILRVGDKASVFTSEVTAYCHHVARELEKSVKGFTFQRKLMDGGTCESSAYCDLGYEATGLCVALGNYHNVNRTAKKFGPEYINLNDFENVVKWFVALARSVHPYTGKDTTLHKQIESLEKTYRSLLRRSLKEPC